MADIELRFHKDMLVLSSSIQSAMRRSGMDVERDSDYAILFEPEVVEELYNFERIAGAQCVVAPTANLTPARLAHSRMEKSAKEIAASAIAIANAQNPQHVLAELAPSGLPLDPSSKNSLIENRNQYKRAAELFTDLDFDAFFLNRFVGTAQLKCALMGIRMVSDVPIFASVDINANGLLDRSAQVQTDSPHNSEELAQAIGVMQEYGANVAGFSTAAPIEDACSFAENAAAQTSMPVLVQLQVERADPDQEHPTSDNPYFEADTMVDAADALRACGVQFLRATKNATPAYTSALVVATDKLDVVQMRPTGDSSGYVHEEDIDDLAQRLRDKVNKAMRK